MTAPAPKQPPRDADLIASGRQVIEVEAQALVALQAKVGAEFAAACRMLLDCRGRVVCTGMGKSGHIARKIAATLASTGTPAFFVHPAEASHGDLGMSPAPMWCWPSPTAAKAVNSPPSCPCSSAWAPP